MSDCCSTETFIFQCLKKDCLTHYEFILFLNNHFLGYFDENLKVAKKLCTDVQQLTDQNFENMNFLKAANDCIHYYNCLYDNLSAVYNLKVGYLS